MGTRNQQELILKNHVATAEALARVRGKWGKSPRWANVLTHLSQAAEELSAIEEEERQLVGVAPFDGDDARGSNPA